MSGCAESHVSLTWTAGILEISCSLRGKKKSLTSHAAHVPHIVGKNIVCTRTQSGASDTLVKVAAHNHSTYDHHAQFRHHTVDIGSIGKCSCRSRAKMLTDGDPNTWEQAAQQHQYHQCIGVNWQVAPKTGRDPICQGLLCCGLCQTTRLWLLDNDTIAPLSSEFWVQPACEELLHAASRFNLSQAAEHEIYL